MNECKEEESGRCAWEFIYFIIKLENPIKMRTFKIKLINERVRMREIQ